MKLTRIAAVMVVCGVSGVAYAADTMTREAVKAEKDRIEADYKAARDQCQPLKDNAQDICQAEAKAKRRIAEAELDAKNKGTAKAHYDLKVTRANAEFDVAKQKCHELQGDDKGACIEKAKAAETKAKADAKAERETAEARGERRPAKAG
jgi:hypothetical protein